MPYNVVLDPTSGSNLNVSEVVARASRSNIFIGAKRGGLSLSSKAKTYQIVFVGKSGGTNKYQALNLGKKRVFNKTPLALRQLLEKLLTKGLTVTVYASNAELLREMYGYRK